MEIWFCVGRDCYNAELVGSGATPKEAFEDWCARAEETPPLALPDPEGHTFYIGKPITVTVHTVWQLSGEVSGNA